MLHQQLKIPIRKFEDIDPGNHYEYPGPGF